MRNTLRFLACVILSPLKIRTRARQRKWAKELKERIMWDGIPKEIVVQDGSVETFREAPLQFSWLSWVTIGRVHPTNADLPLIATFHYPDQPTGGDIHHHINKILEYG